LASEQLGTAVPYTLNPASFAPGKNALFHQNSEGSFTNVAAALGVENPEGRSLGVLWHDFDLDGDLDVYVANDVSDNVLYENLGGRFRDLSHAAHVADYRSAMGLAAADFDRDGDDDMFITHWVAQENGFYENLWADFNHPPSHRVPPVKEGGDRIVHKPSAVAVPADGNEADIAEAPHRGKAPDFHSSSLTSRTALASARSRWTRSDGAQSSWTWTTTVGWTSWLPMAAPWRSRELFPDPSNLRCHTCFGIAVVPHSTTLHL
jgi:hypothetical protein